MTPKVIIPFKSNRKIVVLASKNWKENVRQNCLNRVRRNRLRTTPEKCQSQSYNHNSLSPSTVSCCDDDILPVRQLVEDEMRRIGVTVEKPYNELTQTELNYYNSLPNDENRSGVRPMEVTTTTTSTTTTTTLAESMITEPLGNYYITEEELFEIMEEIEQEIQREKSIYMEEMMEWAHRDLEEQIADFEEWEQSKM